MELNDLKNQIKNKTLDRWYIFIGEEIGVMKLYEQKMADVLEATISYADNIIDLYTQTKVKSLFDSRHLYIIVDDKEFLSNENLHSSFHGLKDDIVIFYYSAVDKRVKFWKNFNDRVVKFDKLEPRILERYIKKDLPDFSDKACQKLISVCEQDYSIILSEIDKIRNYQNANSTIKSTDAFRELLHNGTISEPNDDNFFRFINAVMDRDGELACKALLDIKMLGLKSGVSLIAALYLNFRNILQVQTCNSDNIEKSTGLTTQQVKCILPYINRYNDVELTYIIKLLRNTDIAIKRGTIPDAIAMDYLLANIM